MKWRLFVCADCVALEGVVLIPVEDDANEEAGSGVDYCPACGDYLSMTNMGHLEVTGTALYHLRERSFGGGRIDDE
jgi:hypothetical protein